MSDMYLMLIGDRADHCRRAYHNQNVGQTLTKAVRKSLAVYICRIVEAASEEIGTFLETPKGTTSYIQGGYSIMKRWCQHASGRQTHPYHTYLEKVLG